MSEPTLRILSLGAGVQSSTLALMAVEGLLTGLDGAIFADTQAEPPAVYTQVDRLEAELSRIDVPLYRVSTGNLREDSINPQHRYASVPYFVRNPDGSEGMGRRQCTNEYKLTPIMRKCRELLGAKPPTFRTVPRGRVVEQWVGFSVDEIGRANNKRENLYTVKRFPLLEMGISRKDCVKWLESRGWGHTVKSACVFCPYHGNRQWRDMRDNHPEEWADAVDFDKAIRNGGARGLPLNGKAYLHRSRVPLDEAPIDHITRTEAKERQDEAQHDLFELFEDGDPDGCSPYGCRSGVPVGVVDLDGPVVR